MSRGTSKRNVDRGDRRDLRSRVDISPGWKRKSVTMHVETSRERKEKDSPRHVAQDRDTSAPPSTPVCGHHMCNAPTGVKGQTLAKGVRLLGKSTGSYGEPEVQEVVSPKVDVQAWPLSNTTVQEELL